MKSPFPATCLVGAAVLCAAATAETVKAQGFHVGAGPLHVDVGYPHYGQYGGHLNYGNAGYWGGARAYGGYGAGYHGGWAAHRDWHDTTHFDYSPRAFAPHRRHFHYVPGHYDVHSGGHWD